jgi:hypothetical protein
MKLKTPKLTISEITTELDAINGNVFQLKQFIKFIVPMIEKGDSVEMMKNVVKTFNPMEAIKNLEHENC